MTKKEIEKIKTDCMDPVVMKKVIDTILDPKNPDSESIKKNIIKCVADCIKKDNAFMTTIKGICIERGEEVTTHIVHQSIEDSRDQLTNALVTTVNLRCQEYFEQQKEMITKIIKKTLDDCVKDIIKETGNIISINSKKVDKKTKNAVVGVDVPLELKKDVEDYVDFLKSKKK